MDGDNYSLGTDRYGAHTDSGQALPDRCLGRGNDGKKKDRARLPRAVFWDMDGTLIDSEPYWHEVEIEMTRQYGGHWTSDMGWEVSGKPLPQVAHILRKRGLQIPEEDIPDMLIEGVARKELDHMPWIDGVWDLLISLAQAKVPSILVTTSPRRMAQVVVDQAPKGAFVDFVCGDDGLAQKPDPAPYLYAGQLLGITDPESFPSCIAIEDSITGIRSAVASGATTLAFTGAMPNDTSMGPQFASLNTYLGMTPEGLGKYVTARLSEG